MKNLAEVESRTEKRAAGATETKPSEAEIKGKLVEYAWRMKNQGYQEGTIKNRVNTLKSLARRCNLLNPESVKEAIANTNVGEGRKYGMVDAYKSFASMFGISWRPPRYKLPRKIPFIPLEREVDDLIASSGRVMGTGLRIVKETGARVGEIIRLKWTDIDLVNRIIRFNDPEKGSQARALPMSSKLVAMLERSPKRNEYVFPGKYGHVSITGFSSNQAKARKVAARKLGNPRLLRISFHTIRHWKGTMEYHKTKDIIHVKSVLGHKNIENTMIYINLERISFQTTADEFTVRATNDMEEATKLLEVGFEYICEMDGYKLFRKRK